MDECDHPVAELRYYNNRSNYHKSELEEANLTLKNGKYQMLICASKEYL